MLETIILIRCAYFTIQVLGSGLFNDSTKNDNADKFYRNFHNVCFLVHVYFF